MGMSRTGKLLAKSIGAAEASRSRSPVHMHRRIVTSSWTNPIYRSISSQDQTEIDLLSQVGRERIMRCKKRRIYLRIRNCCIIPIRAEMRMIVRTRLGGEAADLNANHACQSAQIATQPNFLPRRRPHQEALPYTAGKLALRMLRST